MSDLAAFLLARVGEDEQVARSATQGRWFWTDPDTSDFPQGNVRLVADQGEWKTCEHFCTWSGEENIHRGAQGKPGHEHRVTESVVDSWGHDAWGITVGDEDAAHIARHDPARVLADVEAKRRIVELHKVEHTGIAGDVCSSCGDQGTDITTTYYPCETLMVLALPYAAHADYRAEWGPRAPAC